MKGYRAGLLLVSVGSFLLLATSGTRAQPTLGKHMIPPQVSSVVRSAIENLYSPDPSARAYAAMALAKMGNEAEDATPFLRSMLGDGVLLRWQFSTGQTGSSTTPGREAAIALTQVNSMGGDDLLAVLSEAEPPDIERLRQWKVERRNAIAGLGSVKDSRVVERLIQLLEELPGEAARSLGQIGDYRAVEPLIETLAKINSDVTAAKPLAWSVQHDVVVGLAAFSDRRAVDVLVNAIQDQPGATAKAGAIALGNIGDPRAVPALIGLLGTEVTGEAAQALGKIRDRRAIRPLIDVLAGPFAADAVHQSLQAITGQNLPNDPGRWRLWLKENG